MPYSLNLKNIHHFKLLDSTNTEAEKWLLKNTPDEGSVVLADFQTRGQGMSDSRWESSAGLNLLCSIILYPRFLAADRQFMLNKVASLAVKECVGIITDSQEVKIKWPNDIYVGNKKIAGILSHNALIGNKIENTIIGIGLNVNQTQFSSYIPNPVSLKILKHRDYKLQHIFEVLMAGIKKYYQMLADGERNNIDRLYFDSLLHGNIQAGYLACNRRFNGKIIGVSKYGRIQMQVNKEIKEFDIKEVQFLFDEKKEI